MRERRRHFQTVASQSYYVSSSAPRAHTHVIRPRSTSMYEFSQYGMDATRHTMPEAERNDETRSACDCSRASVPATQMVSLSLTDRPLILRHLRSIQIITLLGLDVSD